MRNFGKCVLVRLQKEETSRQLTLETIEAVEFFNKDDEIIRLIPGQRDSITVRGKNKEQKRLIILSLN